MGVAVAKKVANWKKVGSFWWHEVALANFVGFRVAMPTKVESILDTLLAPKSRKAVQNQ